MTWRALYGDCIEVLKTFPDEYFDSVVTDPPYALSFMGKSWDTFDTPGASNGLMKGATGHAHSHGIAGNSSKGFQAWCEDWARECLRVLKPGGHLLAFGGTRTYHREACAIEDAGFEIRDSLHWIYGSGFPKSRDISKAIDKEAGAEREIIGKKTHCWKGPDHAILGTESREADDKGYLVSDITAPATAEAKQWQGWGTALKPAHEPIVVARKPLAPKHTVAANVLDYGTGGINVDGCRIATTDHWEATGIQSANGTSYAGSADGSLNISVSTTHPEGRWPPNVILTHSPDCVPVGTRQVKGTKAGGVRRTALGIMNDDAWEPKETVMPGYASADGTETIQAWDCSPDCPVAEMDRQSGTLHSGGGDRGTTSRDGLMGPNSDRGRKTTYSRNPDFGGASRFFPCFRYQAKAPKKERPVVPGLPGHPTVKPVALMRWLVRLVTPPGGRVLDPFAGTGPTAEACELEGFDCTLIENDWDSIRRIEVRMKDYQRDWCADAVQEPQTQELTLADIEAEWAEFLETT